jgi:hypothetical protein
VHVRRSLCLEIVDANLLGGLAVRLSPAVQVAAPISKRGDVIRNALPTRDVWIDSASSDAPPEARPI